MKIDTNDPTLTAYALGELEPDEAARLEAALAAPENEAARRTVDAVRRTASELADALAAEPAPTLTESQRRRVLEPPAASLNDPGIFRRRRAWMSAGLAAAACITLAVLSPLFLGGPRAGDHVAMEPAAPSGSPEARARKEADGADGFFADRGAEALSRRLDVGDPSTQTDTRSSLSAVTAEGFAEAPEPDLADALDGPLAGGDADGDRIALLGDISATTAGVPVESAPVTATGTKLDDARAKSAPPLRDVERGRASGAAAPPPRPRPDWPSPSPSPAPSGGGLAAMADGKRIEAEEIELIEERLDRGSHLALLEQERRRARPDEAQVALGGADEAGARGRGWNREQYERIVDNPFTRPQAEALSTFAVDVDTASFTNVRRAIEAGHLPPPDAVRLEELLNWFRYDDPRPDDAGAAPFAVNVEVGPAPWTPGHRLVRIGLRGRAVDADMRPATNLVFLVDVSGSMKDADKLPLVQRSLRMLVDRLTPDDRIAIVTYAGQAGVALPSTYVFERETILDAIDRLRADGSTNGGAGLDLAYDIAAEHFIEGGVNRVLLCTDGDFNVGLSSDSEVVRLVEARRAGGVFLSVFGFGTGNLQDAKMEKLSGAGNGTYAYVDAPREAKRLFVDELAGTLVTIAKDVKVQVEFNPAVVGAYRLIGYENRVLAARDFRDDRADAGEIGAGHSVTCLYEIMPPALADAAGLPAVDPLKYQARANEPADASDELLTLELRYKQPDGETSTGFEHVVRDEGHDLEATSDDFRFAAAVAMYGMVLRDSPHKGASTLDAALALARSAAPPDRLGLVVADAREDDGVVAFGQEFRGDRAGGGGGAGRGGAGPDDEAVVTRARQRVAFIELVERTRALMPAAPAVASETVPAKAEEAETAEPADTTETREAPEAPAAPESAQRGGGPR
ncbi:MAG: vWA domain-containing protein [Planctomycetota bacterium]|jgi:Ca-activated chloride channel family protein